MKRKLLLLILCIPTLTNSAVAPYIQIRSQSVDSARELAGWTHFVNLFDVEKLYGVSAITLEYTHSFSPDDITQSMFWDAQQCTKADGEFIAISGSQYPNRNAADLLADYFGLPTDFRSIVKFKPTIKNIILDFNLYLGLDDWLCGLFFRIHAPVVTTFWNLNMCEKITSQGSLGYAPGYFNDSASGVSVGDLTQSFTNYINGLQVPNLGPDTIFEPLKFSKMSSHRLRLTRVSDVEAAFGWNFIQHDDYHLGVALRASAPAGNRPKGQFLFEPMVGNGHHWGLGLGFTAHWELWHDDFAVHSFALYADANIETLLKDRQVRVFDLKKKPLSRYMLAELLGSPAVNLFGNPASSTATTNSTAPSSQFQGVFAPVANLTAIDVESSYPIQADITLLLNYTNNTAWSLDVGYNFWAVTCEKLKETCCKGPLNDNTNWALKGDAYVYGFVAADALLLPPDLHPNDPVALSATESAATIFSGTNTPEGTPFDPAQMRNPNIDNPQFALASTNDDTDQLMVAPNLPADTGLPVNQQRTSVEPVLLSDALIDLDGARTDGLSHKFFVHVSYTGQEYCGGWIPYIGVGGKAEFARHLFTDCCARVCEGCLDTNVSEWGVWLKGGVAF